jgi:hypothetical protein
MDVSMTTLKLPRCSAKHKFYLLLSAFSFVTLTASAQTFIPSLVARLSSGENGTPALVDEERFGQGLAGLGDTDGDGVGDVAIGVRFDLGIGSVLVSQLNSNGSIKSFQRISNNQGGFGSVISGDIFGASLFSLGDMDSDGNTDLGIGSPFEDTGGLARGAFYLSLLNADGTVKSSTKIADSLNGFGSLDDRDILSSSAVGIGDLDRDGVKDLAIGAHGDDTGGTDRGTVYILFMNSDSTVKSIKTINSDSGLSNDIQNGDEFGSSLANMGDIDGDKVTDIMVGARLDDTGGPDRGAVYLVYLNRDGSVKGYTKIAQGTNGLTGLDDNDVFGQSLTVLGDLDGDRIPEVLVGSLYDDTGAPKSGAAYVLSITKAGIVKSTSKIASGIGGLSLPANAEFSAASAILGDADDDGHMEVAIGAWADNTGGLRRGATYIMELALDANSDSIADTITPDATDTDADGTPDRKDTDDDNDGSKDNAECITIVTCPDTDGDGIPDRIDADTNAEAPLGNPNGDIDNDGLPDREECTQGAPCPDSNANKVPDYREATNVTSTDFTSTLIQLDTIKNNMFKQVRRAISLGTKGGVAQGECTAVTAATLKSLRAKLTSMENDFTTGRASLPTKSFSVNIGTLPSPYCSSFDASIIKSTLAGIFKKTSGSGKKAFTRCNKTWKVRASTIKKIKKLRTQAEETLGSYPTSINKCG